jgi:DNA-directed RNA polymerase subunit E'/Rpb7
MEQVALFEEKVYLTPKALRLVAKTSIDSILLEQLRSKLENKCSQHGFVIPNSLELLSRSMGQLENGRFTGNIVFHIQAKGHVYNPANGTQIVGTILKQNKMGLYIIYDDAIRILVPRDLHLGNEDYESLRVGDSIRVELRKSRFQIQDKFILSVGVFVERADADDLPQIRKPEAVEPLPPAQPAPESKEGDEDEEDGSESEAESESESEAEAESEGESEGESEAEGILGNIEYE